MSRTALTGELRALEEGRHELAGCMKEMEGPWVCKSLQSCGVRMTVGASKVVFYFPE